MVVFLNRIKSWFVAGSDDKQVQVFNYNTLEKVISFEAHADYIRSIAVHPTLPLILTSSDDLKIKCWDWEKGWKCLQVFEGHTQYVMQVTFNPKDTNTFASCSLDKTVKVWNLGSSTPNYTLEGHKNGVNCVDYYTGADKPYLISGADDKTAKIWDYTTKACVQTLTGHLNNVTFVAFLPDNPYVVTGSEDGWVKVWQQNTYRLAASSNFSLERAWCVGYLKGSATLAFGFEEGTVVVSLGNNMPVVSMDAGGKIIWAKHNEVQSANVKTSLDSSFNDGDKLALPVKDLGTCEVYPRSLQHSPNGRFVAVCGDGEYIIYTALAWRNKEFGKAAEFAWAQDSNHYAIRLAGGALQLFRAFKFIKDAVFPIQDQGRPEEIFGGALLGVRTSAETLLLFDWETQLLVRKIDAIPTQVLWSETGELVAIVCSDAFFILRYNRSAFAEHIEENGATDSEGVEQAFELVTTVRDTVVTGKWVGDCFLYASSNMRLTYLVGTETSTLAHFDTQRYVLGYLPRDGRVYVMDKDHNVSSYALSLSVLEFKTLVLQENLEAAQALLPSIEDLHRPKLAQFLEHQGHKDLALEISNDVEQQFELALNIGKLQMARDLAAEANSAPKLQLVADKALAAWDVDLAKDCLIQAKDYPGLLLLYTSLADKGGLRSLAKSAIDAKLPNVAMLCYVQLSDNDAIVSLLGSQGRNPEAVLFARTYSPDKVSPALSAWKQQLIEAGHPKYAEALADPIAYPNLFPGFGCNLDTKPSPQPITNGTHTEQEPHTVFNDDAASEAMSLVSMEVNTTGTGSVRGDIDAEESNVIPPAVNEPLEELKGQTLD
ncbi:Coatomer subunit beta' [Entomophthora muscae]|uniref:Coatomer subunit beta n=1 Tax=Entomophthora muscae TaxID=34485 RepID=A0ACC2SLU3_9FUNG|nr:Coatomer subunit beta' [Entomophthora muscae]